LMDEARLLATAKENLIQLIDEKIKMCQEADQLALLNAIRTMLYAQWLSLTRRQSDLCLLRKFARTLFEAKGSAAAPAFAPPSQRSRQR
jgi:hypothetical protein